MTKKKVFITGGRGFIGRNLVEELGGEYDFIAPAENELDLLDADAVLGYVKSAGPDVVLHAANIGGRRGQTDTPEVFEKNLKMYFNVVRAGEFFGRMIVLGSGAEYDKRGEIKKIREEDFGRSVPADEYGFAKYVCAKYAEKAENITHLRLFGIYGKYEDCAIRFVSNAICKAIFDPPITIKQNVYFDYLYVKDLAGILGKFLEKQPEQKIYNIGRGESVDLQTVAEIVREVSGKDLPIVTAEPGLNKEYSCDISRFEKEFGGFNYTSLKDSIKEMFGYYSSIAPDLDKKVFLNDV